jgi:hypothetical protein
MKRSGYQLVSDFIRILNGLPAYQLSSTSISRRVFKLFRYKEILLYVKGRAASPYRWGVTKNVVDRLESQSLPWCVVLLFDSPETGYFLTSNDVNFYISSVWCLGSDGDYKPATGSYLSNNSPFHSLDEFLDQVNNFIPS